MVLPRSAYRMSNPLYRKVAIVGVGATPYYRRGESQPQSITELAGKAILAAAQDAGISVKDIDGFAHYSAAGSGHNNFADTNLIMEALGIPEIGFTATLTMGGGGSAASIGLAGAAILAGDANYVVSLMALQQGTNRFGVVLAAKPPTPESSFVQPAGMVGPGHAMAIMARRHMHKYGTRREAFAEIAITHRNHAMVRPTALQKKPLTLDAYMSARMIADPLCLYDYCLETDGAVAVITTSAERARDLRQTPVYLMGSVHGGRREWGRAFAWMNMPDEIFTSAGNRSIARKLYDKAGVAPGDIDVALLYDHFSPLVMMQLEDYGFCQVGEGGPFVESGATRMDGVIPVNPHGGNLSEGYVIGMTHVREAVEQLRGTAVNQVPNAELALVTGGPAPIPVSGIILGR